MGGLATSTNHTQTDLITFRIHMNDSFVQYLDRQNYEVSKKVL